MAVKYNCNNKKAKQYKKRHKHIKTHRQNACSVETSFYPDGLGVGVIRVDKPYNENYYHNHFTQDLDPLDK